MGRGWHLHRALLWRNNDEERDRRGRQLQGATPGQLECNGLIANNRKYPSLLQNLIPVPMTFIVALPPPSESFDKSNDVVLQVHFDWQR